MKSITELPPVEYEGPETGNPLAFRHYNPEERVEGKPMREHLRFAAAYWHTMRNPLSDPFGVGTAKMPWDDGTDSIGNATRRARVFFEFLEKLKIDFYCFHDRDIAPEGRDLAETNANLDAVVEVFREEQERRGKKLLWGTACLFIHPRYLHGAATSCEFDVYAMAAAQVKKALEVTHALGGEGYVFWGGREGYATLLNTDMKRELDHLARFFQMAIQYKREIGFEGPFYIEPKPKEPTTHQYDSDAAACLNFLRQYELMDDFKLNIETNHAQLAGHTMQHDLRVAIDANALGSIDANNGTENIDWDTDEFPTDLYLATEVMLEVMRMGGFKTGGLNFDAKRRRESFEPEDLFHAHIAGMDTFARGLKIAAAIRQDGKLDEFIRKRYSSWDSELGEKVESGQSTFQELESYIMERGEPALQSGRQEMLQNLVNTYL